MPLAPSKLRGRTPKRARLIPDNSSNSLIPKRSITNAKGKMAEFQMLRFKVLSTG